MEVKWDIDGSVFQPFSITIRFESDTDLVTFNDILELAHTNATNALSIVERAKAVRQAVGEIRDVLEDVQQERLH
jgi:hypothetical protein